VLFFQTENPKMRSAEMAERLAAPIGKPLTANWVRKSLHQAREKFKDLIVEEVAQSLKNPMPETLEEELLELGLLSYCRSTLERRRRGASGSSRESRVRPDLGGRPERVAIRRGQNV
jgi:RNA polymerase sigma-70 factor (ECF subfamily)